MALTITIEGYGELSNAESTTNWAVDGSGGVSISTNAETAIQGTYSIASKVASGKVGWVYFNIGSSDRALDFSVSGTEEDQLIYIWVNCTTLGGMDTINNAGISIRLGSGTNDWREWTLGGAGVYANKWSGGWICAVIDPTTAGTQDGSGTYDNSGITQVGAYFDSAINSVAQNCFVDTITCAKGLRVVGTETTAGEGWKEIIEYCNDTPATRKWGMVQYGGGIYNIYGTIFIGDTTQGADTDFSGENYVIKWQDFEYYNADDSTFDNAISDGINGLVVEDDTVYETFFEDGVIVGSDAGRNGTVFIGSDRATTTFDLYGGNITTSTTKLYGSQLINISGGITWGDDAQHHCYSVIFNGCGQFNPVGGVIIRNCNFINTVSTDGAILWNSSMDIQDCIFIANTTGEAIEHDTWNGLASGTASNTGSETTVLTDTGTNFDPEVSVNDIVYNETDNSYATVTVIDSDTQVTHTALANGSVNNWQTNDAYSFATPISYTNLVFSGNTVDVNNTSAPANVLAISKAGTSDPSTENGFTVIQGSVTVKITVKDKAGDFIVTALTSVHLTSDRTEILNDDTNGSGVAQATYAGTTPVEVEVRCRKASSGDTTRYKAFSSVQTVQSGTGLDLAVTLIEDTNNNATT